MCFINYDEPYSIQKQDTKVTQKRVSFFKSANDYGGPSSLNPSVSGAPINTSVKTRDNHWFRSDAAQILGKSILDLSRNRTGRYYIENEVTPIWAFQSRRLVTTLGEQGLNDRQRGHGRLAGARRSAKYEGVVLQ